MMAAGTAGAVARAAVALYADAFALVRAIYLAAAVRAAKRLDLAQLYKLIEHLSAAFTPEFQKRHGYRLPPKTFLFNYINIYPVNLQVYAQNGLFRIIF